MHRGAKSTQKEGLPSFRKTGPLFWRRPTLARPIAKLPSALRRFTSVFGMGTGGSTAPGSPETGQSRKNPGLSAEAHGFEAGDRSHASKTKASETDFKGWPFLRGPAGKTGVWSAAFPKARAGRDRGERYSIYVGGITKNSAGFRSRKSSRSSRFWHPPDLAGPGFQASGVSEGRSGGRAGRV